MSKRRSLTGKKMIAALERAGFHVDRIQGSHHIMKKPGHRYVVAVPCHRGKTLGAGLINSLLKAAGISDSEFDKLLR